MKAFWVPRAQWGPNTRQSVASQILRDMSVPAQTRRGARWQNAAQERRKLRTPACTPWPWAEFLRRQHLETAAARHGSPSRTSSTKVPSNGPTCCARAVRGPAPSVHQCDVWGVARGRDRPPWLQQPAQRESRRETWHRPVPGPQPRDTVATGRRRRPWAAPPPAVETRPRLWKAG